MDYDFVKHKTEIVRYHDVSETDSEGMTNKTGSCWMICIMQALRASDIFQKQFKPAVGESDELKRELFRLFGIVEGSNGRKKRPLKAEEVNDFREVVREFGLPVKKTGGYSEVRFLRFLLDYLGAKPIAYYQGSRKEREFLLTVQLTDTVRDRTFAELLKEKRVSFTTKKEAPKFLPILLKRPRENKVVATTAIEPSPTVEVSQIPYKLVSIVIARTSISHSYCYVLEDNGWVEYNNHRAILYKSPKRKKRAKDTYTPYEDACRHCEVLIYERL